MLSDHPEWLDAKEKAFKENSWFTPEFIVRSVSEIANRYLLKETLEKWAISYQLPEQTDFSKKSVLSWQGIYPW